MTSKVMTIKKSEEIKEWKILELQGNISTLPVKEDLSGEEIGSLISENTDSKLLIGTNLLNGKNNISLKEEFYVLKKNKETEGFEICAIIKEKLLFNTR
jgi:hypothetical protein